MRRYNVKRKDVKPVLDLAFPEYTGRKISVVFVEKLTLYNLNWDGGSRNEYAMCTFEMQLARVKDAPPWEQREGLKFDLNPNTLVVCHSTFCGVDAGITIYAHPSRMPVLIGAAT